MPGGLLGIFFVVNRRCMFVRTQPHDRQCACPVIPSKCCRPRRGAFIFGIAIVVLEVLLYIQRWCCRTNFLRVRALLVLVWCWLCCTRSLCWFVMSSSGRYCLHCLGFSRVLARKLAKSWLVIGGQSARAVSPGYDNRFQTTNTVSPLVVVAALRASYAEYDTACLSLIGNKSLPHAYMPGPVL